MRASLLAFALTWTACAGSFHAQAVTVAAAATATIDVSTRALLATYCVRLMAAAGRTGTLRDDASRASGVRCEPTGPRALAVGTDAERAAVAATTAAWAPVLDAAEGVVRAQRAAALAARTMASDAAMLAALGALASAYESLRTTATAASLPAPPALNLTGAR